MKKPAIVLIFALLAGCANVRKMEGEQVVRERLRVHVAEAWNKIEVPGATQPYDIWTQDGLNIDQLRIWAGVRSGQAMVSLPNGGGSGQPPRLPTYRAGMPADELAGLVELVFAVDGSVVHTDKVEPVQFAGSSGVRVQFTVLRKRDDLTLTGVAWLAARKDELFAASFVAPRLAFFTRLLPKAEAVVATASIR